MSTGMAWHHSFFFTISYCYPAISFCMTPLKGFGLLKGEDTSKKIYRVIENPLFFQTDFFWEKSDFSLKFGYFLKNSDFSPKIRLFIKKSNFFLKTSIFSQKIGKKSKFL
jgi:hypothetical protein